MASVIGQSGIQEKPASVLAWWPVCWTHILFPGEAQTPGPWRWGPFALLLVLPALLLYPCLSFYLFEPDEGRYAQIPREMLAAGEWIVPTLQGRPYLDKPPLFYWLVMGSYALFGFHEWAARLVPALAVHGTILITYVFGRRLLGQRAALAGALVLTVAPGFAGMGRLLLLDGLLTLWTTLALGAGYLALARERLDRRWWLLASVACGLGVLTKGPVALVLVVPPLWLHRLWSRQGVWPVWRDWLVFAVVLVGSNLPWYGMVCWRLPGFARHFFWEHNILRFVQPFDHERPVWFYVPIMLAGWLPGTLLCVPFVRFLISRDGRGRPVELGFLLLAAGWCLLFFSLAGCKLPTYVLPAFPALSLALGCCLAGATPSPLAGEGWAPHPNPPPQGGRASRNRRSINAGAVLVGCFALMVALHYVIVPWVARVRAPLIQDAAVRELCGDPSVPVFCFPRSIDSAAFYLGRSDLVSYRSKEAGPFLDRLGRSSRAVILFSHRHSLEMVRTNLPAKMQIVHEAPLGLCDLAVVERR